MKNLLYTAVQKLYRFGYKAIKPRSDGVGIIAFEYDNFLLVAKQYIWHGKKIGRVSIHRIVLQYAAENNKSVILYVADQDWFYKLDPERVLTDEETISNRRGKDSNQIMENFNIRLGTRVFQPQTTFVGGFH